MTERLFSWLSQALTSWKFWVVIPPWDVGVRVRLGRKAVALDPGPHFRIPFVDEITLVNTRVRFATPPPVTLAGEGTRCRMVSVLVGFSIAAPLRAMLRYEDPRVAVMAFAQANAAQGRSAEEALERLREQFADAGVKVEFVEYTEDVEAQAIRLLQNQWGIANDGPPRGFGDAPRY